MVSFTIKLCTLMIFIGVPQDQSDIVFDFLSAIRDGASSCRRHKHSQIHFTMVRPPKVHSAGKSDTDSSGSAEPLLADNFPSKAFLSIEFCDSNDPDVACWSRDGTYFVVKNTPTFAASHLPRYFKHSNFQSFVRQLNIYGFRTVKDHDGSDGSVAFHHKAFQQGRRDLLGDIKRSKKSSKKQSSIQEEKKDDYESSINVRLDEMHGRFDDMQNQMDSLSEKLDLLISLVSTNRSDAFVNENVHIGGKRRRQDMFDSRGSPVSDITDPTAVSKDSSHSDSESSSSQMGGPVALPRFRLDMEVVDEEEKAFENERSRRERYGDLMELQESTRELDDDAASTIPSAGLVGVAAAPAASLKDDGEEEEDDADFKMYIDKMLDGDEEDTGEANGRADPPGTLGDSSTFVADPLLGKNNPDTVESATLIPQTTASAVVVHANEEYDEEAGGYVSSAPLTTAVEVTADDDAEHQRRKQHRRRMKIFVCAVILMVCAAFIIWPLVLFVGEKNKKNVRRPPPQYDRPRPDGGYGSGSSSRDGGGRARGDGSSSDRFRDNAFSSDESSDAEFDRAEDTGQHPLARTIDLPAFEDTLTLGLDGETYQCVSVRQPL